MIEEILSCLVGMCMNVSWWVSGWLPTSVPVETAEQALAIGERVAHEEFPNIDYSKYEVQVEYRCYRNGCKVWEVWYWDVNKDPRIFGGGGPEISIRQTDGKILNAVLGR